MPVIAYAEILLKGKIACINVDDLVGEY